MVVEEASASDSFFIAERVLPPLPVALKSGTYPKLKIAHAGLLDATVTDRAPKAEYGRTARSWDTDTYDCVDRGLEELVDDTDAADMARFFNAEAAAAKFVLRNVKLAQEVRVAAAIMSATNFGAGTNSLVAYTSGNIATINFPGDVLAAIERCNDNGEEANTIVMSPAIANRIKLSTLMQNFCRGALPSDATLNVTAAAIARAFADNGITQVLIGRSRYFAGKKQQPYSASMVWGTTYVWVGSVKPGPIESGGAGRILNWNGDGAGLYTTETYRAEGNRSNVVRVRQNTIEKITNGNAGTLITTQYS